LDTTVYWIATGVAFVVSVFCSVVEGALISYTPTRLDSVLRDPARRAEVERYLGHVDRFVFSAIVLNAMSDVVLVLACTLAFYQGLESASAGVYALATSMVVVIIGAEVVPRAFAAYYAESLLPKVLPVIAIGDKVMAPVIRPLWALHQAIARALGGESKERRAEEIKDDILAAALEGSREGLLDPQAQEMIEAVIEFRDVEVRAIMTPRASMAAIEIGTPFPDAVKLALEQGHSRIPVYEKTRDKIVGVLYAKDLLVAWGKEGGKAPKDASLKSLMRKPYFVPETKLIGDLLREFRARKVHIAIVVDEFGGIAGLVTIEDIIEEIVGEIEDEYDTGEEAAPPLRRLDDSTAEVDAKVPVSEVNQTLGLAIPEDGGGYETLGGFLFFALGRVPKKGEKHQTEEADYTVIDGDERRIKRVRVQMRRKQPA
jgi:CBS domain containing-hemolysin-like protein